MQRTTPRIPLLLAIALLVGCPALPTRPTNKPTGSAPVTKASSAPSPGLVAAQAVTSPRPPATAVSGSSLASPAPPTLASSGPVQLGGVVLAPVKFITDHGAGVIANNGASIISNNGSGLVSDNGGSIVSNNGGSYHLTATVDELPFAGARVTVVNAAGQPILGPDGKALVAITDATGHYAFTVPLPADNTVVRVELTPALGALQAIAPKDTGGRAAVGVDFVSTLTTGYILDQYVKGQTDPTATLDRLPSDVEAQTRTKAATSLQAGTLADPQTLTPSAVDTLVDALRQQNTEFDQQMETVRKLLIVAGQADFGTGLPGTQVALSVTGLAAAADGTLYLSSQRGARIWKLNADGTLVTAAGLGAAAAEDVIEDKSAATTNLGAPVVTGFDSAGRLGFQDTALVHGALDTGQYVSRAARIEATGLIGASAEAGRAYDLEVPGVSGGVWGLVKNFNATSNACNVDVWALEPGTPEHALATHVALAQTPYAAGRLDANRVLLALEDATGTPSAVELTLATGATKSVDLGTATSLTVDAAGNVFLLDAAGRLSLRDATGTVTTLASGPPPTALTSLRLACALRLPDGSAAIAATDRRGNSLVYRVKAGSYTLVAGMDTTTAPSNALDTPLTPAGLAALATGDLFLSTDQEIMKVSSTGMITHYAGTNNPIDPSGTSYADVFAGPVGPALQANLYSPRVLHTDAAGNLYVLDGRPVQERIRKIDSTGQISLVQALDPSAQFDVVDFAVSASGSVFVLTADFSGSFTVGWWDAQNVLHQATQTLPPSGIVGFGTGRARLAWAPGDKLYITAFRSDSTETFPDGSVASVPTGQLWSWTQAGGFKLVKEGPNFLIPPLAVDANGRVLLAEGDRILAYDVTQDAFANVAGPDAANFNGRTVDTSLGQAGQLALDSQGNLYIADTGHGQVKRIAAKDVAGP